MKIAICIAAALPLSLLPHLLAPGDTQVAALGAKPQAGNLEGDEGFVPLFNGKDLTGWHNVNCAPGTFYVKDGMIITTGVPTGYLRTAKQYENFILEFEWFHAPKPKGSVGNSGMFVWGDPLPAVGTGYTRSIEVQVLVNLTWKDKQGRATATSQGDLFSIWGAKCKPDRPHPSGWERCLPSEDHCKGEYEWNHYRVVGNNGVLKLTVNGTEVSGVSECKPRKGYLALEAEGSECRFKNLKIKELPSTNPKPDECADVDRGWQSLFTGIDLSGWKGTDAQKAHWKAHDGVLIGDGKGKLEDVRLTSEKSFGDSEMVFECMSPPGAKAYGPWTTLRLRGDGHVSFRVGENGFAIGKGQFGGATNLKDEVIPSGRWIRMVVRVKDDRITVRCNGKQQYDGERIGGLAASGPLALANEAPMRFRNLFVRELKDGE